VSETVYYFTPAKFGLLALQNQRLKIALINELNDPFEFLGANLRNPRSQNVLNEFKQSLTTKYGLICFSRKYDNPVLWAHYADNHRGIALQFEIPRKNLFSVRYLRKRFQINYPTSRKQLQKLLSSKYMHWRYEKESRFFVPLNGNCDYITSYYITRFENGKKFLFQPFYEEFRLKGLIRGIDCKLSDSDIADQLFLGESLNVTDAKQSLTKFAISLKTGINVVNGNRASA